MMLKRLMTNGITVAVAIGAMALVGCGKSGSNSNASGTAAVDATDAANGHD